MACLRGPVNGGAEKEQGSWTSGIASRFDHDPCSLGGSGIANE
jgi:hypothetical protein